MSCIGITLEKGKEFMSRADDEDQGVLVLSRNVENSPGTTPHHRLGAQFGARLSGNSTSFRSTRHVQVRCTDGPH
jgi:hypothetical protein